MKNDLRIELRTRNNLLWHVIFDSHASVSEFCQIHHLDQSHVGGLLNLKASPYDRRSGQRRPIALKLADIALMEFEQLFPVSLYNNAVPHHLVAEVSSQKFMTLNAAKHLALPATQVDEVLASEAQIAIDSALQSLSPRQELVLRKRFGFDGEEESLDQISQELGVSRERVRQIEAKALRKLRHPDQSRRLRGIIDF